MCLCTDCDTKLEEELRGKSLSELCDCDIYTRWICHKCHLEELKFTREYYQKYTLTDRFDERGNTKVMGDHQCTISVSITSSTANRNGAYIHSFTALVMHQFQMMLPQDARGVNANICL